MIPAQRKTSSPRIYYSPQSSTHPSALPSPLSSSSHQAMIISHQPFDGQPFYSQPQQPQQHQQSGPQHPPALRIANPAAYHHLQQQKQQSSTTIDPHLLGINQFGGRPQVKQEEHGMDSYSDAFGPLGTDYELGGALDVNDPTSLMSPISSSPLDDPDFGPRSSSSFTPHGSGSLSTSLQSTPYGTPGMAMPPHGHHPNFYSMSMPVHATNGFSTMEQNKLMGSQPSSFSAYGQIPEIIDENSLKQIDAITEKRRRRRESHNAVERRRRDNINEKIQELATLLPDFASDSQNKPNKGVILRRSVDYIRQIQGFATMQVDRNREIENALRNLLERTGVSESELGLSMPLGTTMEMPTVAPPGPGEQHIDHNSLGDGQEYVDMGDL